MGLVSQYGGLEQLGYLRVAQSMAALIGFIPSAIAPAAISYLSASSADNDQSYNYLKSVHLRGIWALLLVPTGAVCLLLPDIINGLFGSAYQQTTVLAWLSLWISALAGVTSVLVQYLVVADKTVRVAWASLLGVICWIIPAFVLVPQYSALGFLLAQALGQMAGLLVVFRPAIVDIKKDGLVLKNLIFLTVNLFFCTLISLWLKIDLFTNYIMALLTILTFSFLLFKHGLYNFEKLKFKNIRYKK
jgi:O-antigen/teichoic acid export membrane protein